MLETDSFVTGHVLVSAGEASGDRYCARLVDALRDRLPAGTRFFGCAGAEMQASGVEPVVDASRLAVVGLVEVLRHIPRIYGDYRRMIRAAAERRPDFAVLTDSPDFHLRLAPHLKRLGIPVVYLVAPQIWAWREGRIGTLRRNVSQLHCIFPFEEPYFRDRGVEATYIGHPLSRLVRPTMSALEFRQEHQLTDARPIVAFCPGSRTGEAARHLPLLEATAQLLPPEQYQIVAAVPAKLPFPENPRWRVIRNQTWNVLANADVGLVASGTITVEAALLGLPMVSFYKVSSLSWTLGRRFVRAPYLTMVNIIAGREIVPEFMQDRATPEKLAGALTGLLSDADARRAMQANLSQVAGSLATPHDPLAYSADLISKGIIKN